MILEHGIHRLSHSHELRSQGWVSCDCVLSSRWKNVFLSESLLPGATHIDLLGRWSLCVRESGSLAKIRNT
ncbi:hypothetical protein AMECASPLE_018613 [Ameca splendens]|uniref:Uncharacterized protein n=1 Tax=Ameca splendens TaxID=208324 RepID=A0ABV0XFV8_9TELE